MGGICGWVGAKQGRVAGPARGMDALARAMTGAMSHRGNVAWLGDAGDPSGGPAPVVADTSYNTPAALRKAWEDARGDPAAFASALGGSFAAAALDPPRATLALVRDPLGEKPLYYVASPAGVAFASEIKALRAAGFVFGDDLDPAALDMFLAFTYIPAPRTIFRHVRKVPAGHVVAIDLESLAAGGSGAVRTSCWWSLPRRDGVRAGPEEMLTRLSQALERRLPDGGEWCTFLSGGLDSSLVTMLAAGRARASGRILHCFSASFREERLNELPHARHVAGLAGARHHEIPMPEVTPGLVRQVLHHLDEPMADAATLPTWVLADAASRISGVVLTGDGADALLAGDHWFRRMRDAGAQARRPPGARRLLAAAAWMAGPARARRQAEREALAELPEAARYLAIRQKWTPRQRREIYTPDFAARTDPDATAATYLEAPVGWEEIQGEARQAGLPGVDAAMRLDARHGLPEGLLMKGDKMGMAHGVETRSPFVDPGFASWCARLDLGLLLKGGSGKELLKRAALTLLPRGVVRRRKQGLQVPIGRWLRGPLRELLEAAFDPRRLAEQGMFEPRAMASLRSEFDSGRAGPALEGRVWQIVALQTWLASGAPDPSTIPGER